MAEDVDKLLKRHQQLVHSDRLKVVSHVQRQSESWLINTVLVEGHDVPFRFKRKKRYRNLAGARVNMTFYADTEQVAGIEMEIMNVVRIRVS